jgi:hypothetical protein
MLLPLYPPLSLRRGLRLLWSSFALLLACVTPGAATPPSGGAALPLAELAVGDQGEVWTVFQGTTPEPFSVEVAGVIRNALGPGKSLILCRLTDPRVQAMGAVAGMSGSPLYIRGRLAGALSYQVQRFETVRYAGFTPVADLEEVALRLSESPLVPIPLQLGEPGPAPCATATPSFNPSDRSSPSPASLPQSPNNLRRSCARSG